MYISTDYVFDGRSPPYGENDTPNPLNMYGKSKLRGEWEILRHCPGMNISFLLDLGLFIISVFHFFLHFFSIFTVLNTLEKSCRTTLKNLLNRVCSLTDKEV